MSEMSVSLDDLRLLADMDERIADAGGPSLAFQLMMQKQALKDRISFKDWLHTTQALARDDAEEQNAKIAAAQSLSRRAQLRLSSF